mgnify:CR=1 FL=1
MIRRIVATLGATAVLLAAAAPTASAAEPIVVSGIDTSRAPEVTLSVSVPGADPSSPLPASAFTVLESGRRREIGRAHV